MRMMGLWYLFVATVNLVVAVPNIIHGNPIFIVEIGRTLPVVLTLVHLFIALRNDNSVQRKKVKKSVLLVFITQLIFCIVSFIWLLVDYDSAVPLPHGYNHLSHSKQDHIQEERH